MELKDAVESRKALYFSANFMIGLVNNLGYCMIGVSAQRIAKQFGQENLMPLFQLSLVIFSSFIRLINLRYLLGIKHLTRVAWNVVLMLAGFVLMSIATSATEIWGFGVALVATVFTGLSSSWGEALVIGFIKCYPPEFVGSFSSGTGLSGVGGVAIMLGLRIAGLSDSIIFILMLPLPIVYFFCFWFLHNRFVYYSAYNSSLISTSELEESGVQNETGNAVFSKEQMRFVLKNAWFLCLNLGSVYFFEYVIITCFADRVTLHQESGGFFNENSFLILQFCYQFGVLISRSSLGCVKIEAVWILTVLQSGLFVLWWLNATFIFMEIWSEFAVMLIVGLMGGASYVNVAYLILNSSIIPRHFKESATNVSLLFNNIGIILASLFSLLLDNTLLTD